MTFTTAQAGSDFVEVISRHGTTCTVRYWPAGSLVFTTTEYDDEVRFTGSSVVYSGGTILLPLGKSDLVFVEQGKLNSNDVKMYFAGSLTIVPNAQVTVGTTGSIYELIQPEGIVRWEVSGAVIYHKAYARIRTGSP